MPLLRLGPSAAAKEKRLASLLGGRDISGLGLAEAVREAQVLGSLDLAAEATTPREGRAPADGRAAPGARGGGPFLQIPPRAGGRGGGAPPPPPIRRGGPGAAPPILVGADGPRIEACLQAAFQLSTEPLTSLLDEASERALEVMIQALADRGP